MSMRWPIVLAFAVCSLAAAADKKKPKLDLGLPASNFSPVPTGEGMQKKVEKQTGTEPTVTTTGAHYEVVRVSHGKAFIRTPAGAQPSTPFPAVQTSGNPPVTEKFSSVVRVKCPEKVNAPIEIVILDMRGDTVMDASGQLQFRGQKETELDWTVDWEPTQLQRGAGAYQVLVRVGGQPMGTFPLTMAEPPAKGDPAKK